MITVQILLQIFIILIGLYLAFFKSYFTERGKILATKKDVDEITEKVEKIKSDIGFLAHKRISLSTEKQNSLIDFNGRYSAWINFIMHVSISGDTENPDQYFSKIYQRLDEIYYDFAFSEARFDLFFHKDADLMKEKNSLKLLTIELSNLVIDYLSKVGVKNKVIMLTEKEPAFEGKEQETNTLYKELIQIVKDCQESKMEKYKLITKSHFKMINIISERIFDFETRSTVKRN